MSVPENGQVNLNYFVQDKKFQARPAYDPRTQKSSSSERVAPIKLPKAFFDRMIGCSSGMVKDKPSLPFVPYERTVDGDLLLMWQNGDCHVTLTHEDGSSVNFLIPPSLLHKLLKPPGRYESVYMRTKCINVYSCFCIPQVHTSDSLADFTMLGHHANEVHMANFWIRNWEECC